MVCRMRQWLATAEIAEQEGGALIRRGLKRVGGADEQEDEVARGAETRGGAVFGGVLNLDGGTGSQRVDA